MKSLVSTVIPTYNESMNIIPLLERLLKAAKNKYPTEIIVVDDDSPDKTWSVAKDFAEKNKHKNIKIIRRMNERGLASAIQRGIQEAKGDIISWIDADLGVPPEIIPKLVKPLDKYDVAIASRYIKGGKDARPKFRRSLSVILNLFIQSYLNLNVKDCTSCVVAAKRKVFQNITFSTKGFGEFFIEFIYKCKKNKFSMTEVPVVYEPQRAGGESKSDSNILTLFKLGIQYGLRTLRIRFVK